MWQAGSSQQATTVGGRSPKESSHSQ